MSLIIINSNVETINDQCAAKDITDLIRQHMGDDMADYVEQTMKDQDEQNEELLDILKSVGKDLSMLRKRIDVYVDCEDMIEVINNVHETISDELYGYGMAV